MPGTENTGYRIALMILSIPDWEPLLDLADIVKVDFRSTTLRSAS